MKKSSIFKLSAVISSAMLLAACGGSMQMGMGSVQVDEAFVPRSVVAKPIVDVGPVADTGLLNYQQSNLLMNLTTDQAKALIIDLNPFGKDTLFVPSNKRLTVSYLSTKPLTKDEQKNNKPEAGLPYTHVMYVVNSMMNNSTLVPHPGFLGKHGLIHVIGFHKGLALGQDDGEYVFGPNMALLSKETVKYINAGYNGVNISFGGGVDPHSALDRYVDVVSKQEKISREAAQAKGLEIWNNNQEYLATAMLVAPGIYQKPNKEPKPKKDKNGKLRKQWPKDYEWTSTAQELDRWEWMAKKDVNITYAAGNNGDSITLFPVEMLYMYADSHLPGGKHRWQAATDSTIIVTALSLTSRRYTNACAILTENCLAANDWAYVQNPDKPLDDFGAYDPRSNPSYIQGTSFATPYTLSVVLMVRSVFPFFTNYNAQTTVLTTARQIVQGERLSLVYGWGLVQPQAAVNGPAMFFRRDFVADFTHNEEWIKRNAVYTFSNDISGEFGLRVKGNARLQPVLSLAGNNSYQGATWVQANAILYVPGVIKASTLHIEAQGTVIGSGQLANVQNDGRLVSFSPELSAQPFAFKPRNVSHFDNGLLVNGDFTQGKGGELQVALGKPMLVSGQVTMGGVLRISGSDLKNASRLTGLDQLKDGKGMITLIVSKTAMKGAFSRVVVDVPGVKVIGKPVVKVFKNDLNEQYRLQVKVELSSTVLKH